jgi:hypothetical protein
MQYSWTVLCTRGIHQMASSPLHMFHTVLTNIGHLGQSSKSQSFRRIICLSLLDINGFVCSALATREIAELATEETGFLAQLLPTSNEWNSRAKIPDAFIFLQLSSLTDLHKHVFAATFQGTLTFNCFHHFHCHHVVDDRRVLSSNLAYWTPPC